MAQRTPPSPEQVEAIERKLGNLAVNFLILIGLWLVLAPLAAEYTGYLWMRNALGGDGAVARFFVAFLFLYFAGIVREKNELRSLLKRLVGSARAATQQEPEQARTAVELLIQGLEAANPETRQAALDNLRRLTGEDFGQDREAWQVWWRQNRDSFTP